MERLLTIKHFVHFHHGSGFGVTYLPRFFSLSQQRYSKYTFVNQAGTRATLPDAY